jgi:membrane fusion protein (multidrug efflux system)
VLLLLLAMTGALGYKKFLQIQVMMAEGSVPPPPISVTVAVAKPAEWNRRIKAIGTLTAYQGVDISSEVAGKVKSINFESGQDVKTGTLLVDLDSQSEIASLASAKAQYEADYSQYQRILKLKDKKFVTKNDLDTQLALVDIARSQIGVAEAALSKKSILAPFSGKLGIRQIDLGEYIAPGTSIVTLQSIDQLLLDFTLPESNFKDLSVGQPVSFKVRSFPGRTFDGKITAWNPVLDENTRNVSIQAEVNNKERLLAPGMFAQIEVESTRKQSVLTVPETSIFYNIYGEAVYVLEKPEATDTDLNPGYILAARQIQVAYRDSGVAGVHEGLMAGDQVVTAGQLKLFPSLKVVIVDDVPEYNTATQ